MKRFSLRAQGLMALAVVSLLSCNILAANGDWPQWRGPLRDGKSTETGLLASWPAGGPPLLWTVRGLGDGYSGVSLQGEVVFTSGDVKEESFVIALKRSDGTRIWASKLGKGGAPGWGGFAGPRCTPSIANGLVFAVGQFGDFVCLDATTGKELWHKNLSGDFGGSLPEWGFSESPLVDGDNVILTPGGEHGAVVALSQKTGDLVWRCEDFKDAAAYASLVPVEMGGVKQYVQLTQSHLAGINAASGKLIWLAPRKGETAVITTPVVEGDLVYATSGYGVGCNMFKVSHTGDAFSAEQIYANKVMANHHGGVIALKGYVYGYSEGKGWVCQDIKTGKAAWEEKGHLGKGSIAYAEGRFYLRQEDGKGTIALIGAEPTGYKEFGRFDQPERSEKNSWPHPVIAGGRLYIRDQGILLCYDIVKR